MSTSGIWPGSTMSPPKARCARSRARRPGQRAEHAVMLDLSPGLDKLFFLTLRRRGFVGPFARTISPDLSQCSGRVFSASPGHPAPNRTYALEHVRSRMSLPRGEPASSPSAGVIAEAAASTISAPPVYLLCPCAQMNVLIILFMRLHVLSVVLFRVSVASHYCTHARFALRPRSPEVAVPASSREPRSWRRVRVKERSGAVRRSATGGGGRETRAGGGRGSKCTGAMHCTRRQGVQGQNRTCMACHLYCTD